MEPEAPPTRARSWPSLLIGVAAAAVMLFPAFSYGLRLPLQNLWNSQVTEPEDMPFALLPLSQYFAINVFVMLVMGGVIAGLAMRVMRRRWMPRTGAAALGVLLVHGVVSVQAFVVIAGGLGIGDGSADARQVLYFSGMLGGVVIGILFAQLGLWLISRASVMPAALGIVLAAVPASNWLSLAVVATPAIGGWTSLPLFSWWLPGIIVGVTLAWCGVRPLVRLIVWVVGLLAVWVVPALFTAIMYALGSRVFDGDLGMMAEAGTQVFPQVLAVSWQPALVALVIGVIGVVVRMLVGRNHSRSNPRSV